MSINSIRDDESKISKSKIKTLLRLFKYLTIYVKEIVMVLLMMLVTIVIFLVNPLIIERAIDFHIANKDFNGLIKLGVFAVILNIIYVVLVKLRMFVMARVSNEVLMTIRQELYSHIQKLSFKFFDNRPTGKILARIIGDVNALKNVLSNSVTTLIPDFITILAVVAIMVVKNYKLALASLISLPLLIIGMWFIQVYSHVRWQIHRSKSSNLTAFIHEYISGIRIIQSFTAEEESMDGFKQLVKEHRKSFVDAVLLSNAFGPVIDICWAIGTFALYYIGVNMIGREAVPIGTLIAFGYYISMFWRPIMNLSNFYNQLVTNVSAAERIFEIMDTPVEIFSSDDAIVLEDIKGDVRFENVTFSYDDKTKVLDNVSFHVKPGETIALVGPTGAGKTTVINLISRFYENEEGNIYIDGHNIKDIALESLREQMGVMTQDNFLFTGTIKDNIRYGKLDASDEEIINAAKAVNAHDFIMKLENGYDTKLQERGIGLSIGQRQLIAFARTMVSMPRILI
ncbi:MAG: ABC transporter ATP-binding protein, partial [Clostridiales bacterium]|nr:ABC transporter ATP-binding protein [Clostridiales bacterium]